jgi:hypothetical protein
MVSSAVWRSLSAGQMLPSAGGVGVSHIALDELRTGARIEGAGGDPDGLPAE